MFTRVVNGPSGESLYFDENWPLVTSQELKYARDFWPEVIDECDRDWVCKLWRDSIEQGGDLDLFCKLANGREVRAVSSPVLIRDEIACFIGTVCDWDDALPDPDHLAKFLVSLPDPIRYQLLIRPFFPLNERIEDASMGSRCYIQPNTAPKDTAALQLGGNPLLGVKSRPVDDKDRHSAFGSGAMTDFPVFLVPIEHLERAREFDSKEDANLWVKTFNESTEDSGYLAIRIPAHHLRIKSARKAGSTGKRKTR